MVEKFRLTEVNNLKEIIIVTWQNQSESQKSLHCTDCPWPKGTSLMSGFSVRISTRRKGKALGNLVFFWGVMAWIEPLIYSLIKRGAVGIPRFEVKESAEKAVKDETNA